MAHLAGELQFHGNLVDYRHFEAFCLCIREAKRSNWVVYSKRPFGGPEKVLAYLGRYTHRVAISNQRLERSDGQSVSFRWKDYRSGQRDQLLELDAVEFLRRFLLHTLPRGFVRIRHYGFLSNRFRKENLKRCRACFRLPALAKEPSSASTPAKKPCPHCQNSTWVAVGVLLPRPVRIPRPCRSDSS